MKFLFSLILLSILIFSLSCKTTTQDQSSISSSEQQTEETKEKPQSIVIPVSSLGDVSETRQQILQNSLEDELKEHFTLISQERFEEAQEKAFEQLEYEECTEDQCIMLIQEMLQVENVFHLQVIGEGSNTQLSLSWRTLDENKKETDTCLDCGTFELDKKIEGLIKNLIDLKYLNENHEINKSSEIYKFDGTNCFFRMLRPQQGYKGNPVTEVLSSGKIKIEKNNVNFVGEWHTGGKSNSQTLTDARVIIDNQGNINGVIEVYTMFYDGKDHPPVLVDLSNKDGKLEYGQSNGFFDLRMSSFVGKLEFRGCSY